MAKEPDLAKAFADHWHIVEMGITPTFANVAEFFNSLLERLR
jgi:hypothetical protein